MKKMRLIALILALAMILCIPAAAEDTVVDGEKATATIKMGDTSAVFSESGDMVTVTVTSNSLKAGSQYVILMVKGSEDDYTINADSILYIDQKAASASGAQGTVTFDVYPSAMADGVILIAGADGGPLTLAIINAKYILGDVNADGNINADDALLILQHSVGLYSLTDDEQLAANVQNDSNINADDALLILQYSVGIIGAFN